MTSAAFSRLGQVSALYAERAQSYQDIAVAAANAEADYRRLKAQTVLRHKASADRMSQAEAEARADADEAVSSALRQRLTTAAVAEAHRERLKQLREQVAVGRSFAVAEREGDRLHASGGGP